MFRQLFILVGMGASMFGASMTMYDFEESNLTQWQSNAHWAIQEDKSSMVLSLVEPSLSDPFNLCFRDDIAFLDGNISVLFRANQGKIDQGGGLMWRVQDAKNYYVVRFNPLENNFRFYLVQEGKRLLIASADVVLRGGWHEMRIEQRGDHLLGYLDNQRLLDLHDNRLPHAGGVGLWSKADALSSFDNLLIEKEK